MWITNYFVQSVSVYGWHNIIYIGDVNSLLVYPKGFLSMCNELGLFKTFLIIFIHTIYTVLYCIKDIIYF